MEVKELWIRRVKFGKVKYMCGGCRKCVTADEEQLKKMIYCPYCGEKKKGIQGMIDNYTRLLYNPI